MRILPPTMFQHITIEEIHSLTEDELDMLIFICNIWAPIRPPIVESGETYLGITHIRSAKRDSILDRVIQAEKIVAPVGMEIYEELRKKLSIPVVKNIERATEPFIMNNIGSCTISGSWSGSFK
jgi:hypothetical protein